MITHRHIMENNEPLTGVLQERGETFLLKHFR